MCIDPTQTQNIYIIENKIFFKTGKIETVIINQFVRPKTTKARGFLTMTITTKIIEK